MMAAFKESRKYMRAVSSELKKVQEQGKEADL
jgi:hypothetical protein